MSQRLKFILWVTFVIGAWGVVVDGLVNNWHDWWIVPIAIVVVALAAFLDSSRA